MDLEDLIGPDDIFVSARSNCKKQVLQDLAEEASRKTGIPSREIFETLLERERLGSTGVGHGIAIPHGKLKTLDKIVGMAAILGKPIEFDALDDQPVDVVFLLLAPEDAGAEHLKALARVARVLREPGLLSELREAESGATAHKLMTRGQAPNAA
ncbi:MAG: PTS sugar transporter subunit IIA [Chloroflexota bacterium]|jgi:nitrogen PTS system EIIA component